MFADKLRRPEFPEEFRRRATDTIGIYFVRLEHPVRIDNERAAPRIALFFNIDAKLLRELARSIGNHRKLHLCNRFGMIVPCLVRIDGIGTHGENLGIEFLEFLVMFRQILKLRRTHKGEIRRIKEENDPLPSIFREETFHNFVFVVQFQIEIRHRFANFNTVSFVIPGVISVITATSAATTPSQFLFFTFTLAIFLVHTNFVKKISKPLVYDTCPYFHCQLFARCAKSPWTFSKKICLKPLHLSSTKGNDSTSSWRIRANLRRLSEQN